MKKKFLSIISVFAIIALLVTLYDSVFSFKHMFESFAFYGPYFQNNVELLVDDIQSFDVVGVIVDLLTILSNVLGLIKRVFTMT